MSTALYGILGWPIAHTRSPGMHNAAFAALGLDAVYVPFAVAPHALDAAVDGLRALGVRGANVTVPHKEHVARRLDRVDGIAAELGAVNTIYRDGDALVGTNTDAPGLVKALLEANVEVRGARVVVLGAGGAAAAALHALRALGADDIAVCARDRARAEALCARLGVGHAALLDASPVRGAELVVQATSAQLGADGDAFVQQLGLDALAPSTVALDLAYGDTPFVQAARAAGLRTLDGTGMLLWQGVLAFERWTGRDAPVDVMRAAVRAQGIADTIAP